MADQVPLATLIYMLTVKLSSSNYLIWRKQVLPVLSWHDLLPHIDGSVEPPSAMTTNDEDTEVVNLAYAQWKSKDQRVLSLLQSSLTEEALAEILNCSTARAVWVTLESAYSYSTDSRAHQLRDELQLLKRGTMPVIEYSRKFKLLCDQLASISHLVIESDKRHWYLRGLGLAFKSFADVRLAISPIPQFTDLVHQAMNYKLNSQNMDDAAPAPAAFVASDRSTPKTHDGRGSSGHTCGGGSSSTGHGHGQGKKPYVPR